MSDVERILEQLTVEGEIGLVIDYEPGRTLAVDVLQAAMGMIQALDRLDGALLSSVDTSLEPISVLNDVQHSSLKLILARALRHVPDDAINSLDWKKWVGGLLVKGKHRLLSKLDADAPDVAKELKKLALDYRRAPIGLIGYEPPKVADVMDALDGVAKARAELAGNSVIVQTELGDIALPDTKKDDERPEEPLPQHELINRGTEFFKIKAPDLLGASQWTVIRNGRHTKVSLLHKSWLARYHKREFSILPGDSLKCRYEEQILYDGTGNEIERHLAIVEVIEIISPPHGTQPPLLT